jgi:hypothetical protein
MERGHTKLLGTGVIKTYSSKVCRPLPTGLYVLGNGLVTAGRFGVFREWFQEVEVRAQLVVVE